MQKNRSIERVRLQKNPNRIKFDCCDITIKFLDQKFGGAIVCGGTNIRKSFNTESNGSALCIVVVLRIYMMRKLIAVALIALAMPTFAHAKTLTLGADAPVVTVDVPDEWSTNEYPNGVAVTATGNYLITVEVVPFSDITSKMEAAMKYFMDQGFELDETTPTGQDVKINGYDFKYTEWRGKDKKGPAIVTIAGMVLNDEQIIQINTWGSEKSDKANSDALLALVNSIKPAQ